MESQYVKQKRKQLDNNARAQGIDVDAMHRRHGELLSSLEQAIQNVSLKKSLWKRLWFRPMGPGLGNMHPEVEAEWNRLNNKK